MYRVNVGEFLQRFPVILLTFFVTINVIAAVADRSSDVTFQFPEYDYKETSKNVWANEESTKYRFYLGLSFVNQILCGLFICLYSMQELSYREFESACDQSNRCENLMRIARVRCIRECISPSCYHEIYESDEVNRMNCQLNLCPFRSVTSSNHFDFKFTFIFFF